MQIFNTLTRQKEEFVPQVPGEYRIYVCGPTVYNYIHIGNARPLCIFDILRRYLEYRGYKVTFVQNFTDIDDKIIRRANEEHVDFSEISERYIKEFWTDADGLNVRHATVNPKATENIDAIIHIISTLIEKGYAYEAGGNIYFDTSKLEKYYVFNDFKEEDLAVGVREGVEEDENKRNKADFVLWFTKSKFDDQELKWDSPWGVGYPGWHIECSCISMKNLGEYLDIHCGGIDNAFPHHTNEIAQSESYLGHPWCPQWCHVAHLNTEGGKMSKSKGNVVDPYVLAEKFGVDALRFFLLRTFPFGSDGNFSNELLIQTINMDLANDLGNLVSRTTAMVEKYFGGTLPAERESSDADDDLKQMASTLRDRYEAEMEHFQFQNALEQVFKTIQRANKYIDETAPWVLAKDEAAKDRLAEVLYNLVESITIGACLLKSFLPETADRILAQLNAGMREYDNLDKFGLYENGNKVTDKPEILFARLDAKEIMPKIDAIREAQKAEFEAEQKALGELPETTEESGEAIDIEAKPEIEYDDFMKMQFQVGEIISCEAVPKSKKLLCSQVKIGSQVKQIVSGIRKYYTPEEMVGKKVMVLVNLKPAKLAGVLSEGMLLCAEDAEGNLALMTPEKAMPSGAEIC